MNTRPVWTVMAAMALASVCGGSLSAAPPPAGGTIAIEPRTVDGDYDPSLHVFTDAAAAALAARGFTILDDSGHAAYVAELTLSRVEVGTGLAKTVGDGGIVPSGAGVSIPFSTGRSNLVPLTRTRVELRMHERGDPAVIWNAAAVTVRAVDGGRGADATVASDLGAAICRTYPAMPEGVVGVP